MLRKPIVIDRYDNNEIQTLDYAAESEPEVVITKKGCLVFVLIFLILGLAILFLGIECFDSLKAI